MLLQLLLFLLLMMMLFLFRYCGYFGPLRVSSQLISMLIVNFTLTVAWSCALNTLNTFGWTAPQAAPPRSFVVAYEECTWTVTKDHFLHFTFNSFYENYWLKTRYFSSESLRKSFGCFSVDRQWTSPHFQYFLMKLFMSHCSVIERTPRVVFRTERKREASAYMQIHANIFTYTQILSFLLCPMLFCCSREFRSHFVSTLDDDN